MQFYCAAARRIIFSMKEIRTCCDKLVYKSSVQSLEFFYAPNDAERFQSSAFSLSGWFSCHSVLLLVTFPLSSVFVRNSCIGLFFIRQLSKVIHAGVQRKRNPAALFKRVVPFPSLQLRVIALVNAGQHLHLNLRELAFFAQLHQSCHFYHHVLLWCN